MSGTVKGPVVNGGDLQLGDRGGRWGDGESPWEQTASFVNQRICPGHLGMWVLQRMRTDHYVLPALEFMSGCWNLEGKGRPSRGGTLL